MLRTDNEFERVKQLGGILLAVSCGKQKRSIRATKKMAVERNRPTLKIKSAVCRTGIDNQPCSARPRRAAIERRAGMDPNGAERRL